MRLAVLTALHGRERLTRLVLRYWARLAQSLPVDAVRLQAVASMPVEWVAGWHYVDAPNDPLAAKFNAGMMALREWDPDAVMVIGSDDLVSRAFVEAAVDEVANGAEMVYPSAIYMLNAETGHLHYARAGYIGAGRILTRPVLSKVGWAPWPADADRRLDGLMRRHLETTLGRVPMSVQVHPTTIDALDDPRVILDVKTGENMWSIPDLARLLPVLDLGPQPEWIARHFPNEADELNAWKPQPLTC